MKKLLIILGLTLVIINGMGTNTLSAIEVDASSNKIQSEEQMIIFPEKIEVIFPDSSIAESIAQELNKTSAEDTVTQLELESITTLQVISKNVTTLEGLNYLSKLTDLDLGYNQIVEVGPLSELTNLVKLDLSSNHIQNITSLSKLTKLQHLGLGWNKISDISSVAYFENLEYVSLHYNNISDVDVLASLVHLNELSLHNNEIHDVSPLVSLTNLTYLSLSENNFADMSSWENIHFPYLETITLGKNEIENINWIQTAYLPSLTELWISDNKISDISVLENVPTLETLSFDNNTVKEISVLTKIPALKYVWGIGNNITDVSPIASFNTLIVKSFQNQKIELESIPFDTDVSLENIIIGYDGNILAPSEISNAGSYENHKITWIDISENNTELTYSFFETWNNQGGLNGRFSGTVTLPLNHPEVYPITYELDGGVNGATNPEDYTYGVGVTEFSPATKTGYKFLGWYDANDSEITEISTTEQGVITLYAKWGEVANPVEPSLPTPTETLPTTGEKIKEKIVLGIISLTVSFFLLLFRKK